MEEKRYRTRQEMIEYFKSLAFGFSQDAAKAAKSGNDRLSTYSLGKSEAYQMAAFELEHNMEG